MSTLRDITTKMMAQGKGILAADESNRTANKRLESVGVEATEESRKRYRDLLFTTPGIEKYLSGVILFDETIRQESLSGTPFYQILCDKEILVGIKVDEGLEEYKGGKVTNGLEGLDERLKEYKTFGAVFTKWRAVVSVGESFSEAALKETAKCMAAYAKVVQDNEMVPIVEPEVLIDGAHSAEEAGSTMIQTLKVVFQELKNAEVDLSGVVLKTSMAVSGKDATSRADAKTVADLTVDALVRSVPKETGGVVFLSGGQTPEEAAANLNAIARIEPLPWPITFSYSRAIQEPVLEEWSGNDDNLDEAQAIFLKRLTLVVAADAGGYSESMENSAL